MFTMNNFIAEIGVNHENSTDVAKLMIKQCAVEGVGAVKFQSYVSEKIAAVHSPAYWDTAKEPTRSQRTLFSKYDKFDIDVYNELKAYCVELGVEFMSTPFDVDYARSLNEIVDRFKVASVDLDNYFLIDQICEFDKPILLSVGASEISEIDDAVERIHGKTSAPLTLLHCVSRYPTPVNLAGLKNITILKSRYPNLGIGYSDHTCPNINPDPLLVAIMLGASVIEKHFTCDKLAEGNDHYHAFDRLDLREFRSRLEHLDLMTGGTNLEEQESARINARRGVYAARDISAGEKLSPDDFLPLRPRHDYLSPAEVLVDGKNIIALRKFAQGEGISRADVRFSDV